MSKKAKTTETESALTLECPPDLATAFADNMAVGNLQNENQTSCSYKGGVDTLHLSLVVEWGERFTKSEKLLRYCQEASKKGDDSNAYFRLGDQVFRVFPNGAGRGKGCFRHFIIDGAGIHFELSRISAPGPDYFNAVVVIGSVTCNSVPLEDLWKRVNLVVRALGGRILNETISRFDPYVDAAGIPFDAAMNAWATDRIICRARSFAIQGKVREGQTLRVGSGTFIRIYNKLAELQAKPNAQKEEQIAAKFGGQMPEVLTRFEFQCNRRFLREAKINRFQDLVDNVNSICAYLSRDWFRIVSGPVDRRQTQRSRNADWWEDIAKTFETIGEDAKKNLVRVTKRVRNAPALIRQAVGCLLKAVHGDCQSIAGFLKASYESLRQDIVDQGNDEFYSRLARCHATGLTARTDQAISGPPKFVTAESVLARVRSFYGKQEEYKRANQGNLFADESAVTYCGESWADGDDGSGIPEVDYVF